MREVRLRHHHLLCTRTFSGKGYDPRFVANMEKIVSALLSPNDHVIRLSASCDDICSSCPNKVRGRCKDQESVLEKDRSAAMFLSLPEETTLPAEPLLELVNERMCELDDIRLICGECEWAELCNEWLASSKKIGDKMGN
jgi:uncharacterized protein